MEKTMSPFRVLHISDTHLSPRTEHFRQNNEDMLAPLKAADHDYIIHTGDITLDGIRYEEDYVFCRDFFARTGKAIRYIPGNHDIGDNPNLSKPEEENGSRISARRLARFAQFYGADHWAFERDGWRVLGINSMLIGSGLPQEIEQFDWIDAELESLEQKHLAVFTHQPLFIDVPEVSERTYWTVDPSGTARLRKLINHPALKFIGSGHLHQQRSRRFENIRLEWCSSIAFTTHEALVPEMGGTRRVGYLEHCFHPDGEVETNVRGLDSFTNNYLDDVIDTVYPKY
jgi:3',5'-cyclic AMP phosphodiesterase CpdA